MSPQTENNSPFPLQTKVTTRRKITYTSLKKKKINTCFTATSIKPSGAVTPARTKYVKTRASLARFICARVAHCFTFSTGSVVVQWLTEVQELVIDVTFLMQPGKCLQRTGNLTGSCTSFPRRRAPVRSKELEKKKRITLLLFTVRFLIPNTKTFHTRF